MLARSRGLSRTDKYQVLLNGSPGRNVHFRMRGEPGPAPGPLPVAVLSLAGELMRVQPPGMPHWYPTSSVVPGKNFRHANDALGGWIAGTGPAMTT